MSPVKKKMSPTRATRTIKECKQILKRYMKLKKKLPKITFRDAASRLGVSKSILYDWVKKGVTPSKALDQTPVFYALLEQWALANIHRPKKFTIAMLREEASRIRDTDALPEIEKMYLKKHTFSHWWGQKQMSNFKEKHNIDTPRKKNSLCRNRNPQGKKRDREIWDLHQVLDLSKRRKEKCDSKDCGEIAVAYWKSTHGNHWHTCESCQLKDFRGWPEGVDFKKQKCIFLSLPQTISKKKKKIAKTKDLKRKQEETNGNDKAIRSRDLPERVVLGPKQAPPNLSKDRSNKRDLATIEFQERKVTKEKATKEKVSQGWSKRQSLYSIPDVNQAKQSVSVKPFKYKFRRGGTLTIYPNLISELTTKKVKEELLSCGLFRQYRIQAQDEPRLHFLLHSQATEDFEASAQPGYQYASIRMKARPLNLLPELNRLSAELAKECNVEDDWSIGINPVLYRDQQDRMGGHADDDQEEEIILCLIVASPEESARRVVITPKKTMKSSCLEEGDERIELFLLPGDAYEMDGEMQKYYIHSVPNDKESKNQENSTRVVVVFRTGKRVLLFNDTGRSCKDLSPRLRKIQTFGKTIEGLKEGHVYTRPMLYQMYAHCMQQRGVSGNITNGCDAIIWVQSPLPSTPSIRKEEDGKEEDNKEDVV